MYTFDTKLQYLLHFDNINIYIYISYTVDGGVHKLGLFVIPSHVKSQDLAHLYLLQPPVEPCQNYL